jgi:putative GTP pyrophosphokinase
MVPQFNDEESSQLKKTFLVYEWAHRILLTKMSIIQEDLASSGESNPIESIKGRIKSESSIAAKLDRLGFEVTAESARTNIKDIAGIRVICPFAKDIYFLAEMLRSMPDIRILDEKDYVTHPKPSGYRSYHIITETPVFYSGKTENIPVEIQLRTEAMNFWATLEHKARYKYKELIPQHLSDELVICANKIADLDGRMFLIHEIIGLINQDT